MYKVKNGQQNCEYLSGEVEWEPMPTDYYSDRIILALTDADVDEEGLKVWTHNCKTALYVPHGYGMVMHFDDKGQPDHYHIVRADDNWFNVLENTKCECCGEPIYTQIISF